MRVWGQEQRTTPHVYLLKLLLWTNLNLSENFYWDGVGGWLRVGSTASTILNIKQYYW